MLEALRSGASLQLRFGARSGSGRCQLRSSDGVEQLVPESVFRQLREHVVITQAALRPGVSEWIAADSPRNGWQPGVYTVTFSELCQVVRLHKEAALASLESQIGSYALPFNGRYDSGAQEELILKALVALILERGTPFVYNDCTIGVSPTSSRGCLAATKPGVLAMLIDDLRTAELDSFPAEATARWVELQHAAGRYRRSADMSQAEAFSQQRFRGFD